MNIYNIIDKKLFNLVYNLIINWYNNFKINKCNNHKIKKLLIYIFRRKMVTYNNMILSIYYLFIIKKKLQKLVQKKIKIENFFLCGSRMFLISLILANKYIYDKCYKNITWSKITGLKIKDINLYENKVLNLLKHDLYISDVKYNNWKNKLLYQY